jgi:hypothetical protein
MADLKAAGADITTLLRLDSVGVLRRRETLGHYAAVYMQYRHFGSRDNSSACAQRGGISCTDMQQSSHSRIALTNVSSRMVSADHDAAKGRWGMGDGGWGMGVTCG